MRALLKSVGLLIWLSIVVAPRFYAAAEEPTAEVYQPVVQPASDEADRAIQRIRVPGGLKLSLVAAEPLLANPVAFSIDERGRFYVAETFRLHAGVTDNRGHMNWLEDDLACRTVADRVAMYRKYLGDTFASYEVEHDRVRRLEDRDGDGRIETSTVLADGFHHAADGIGSGVLARRGKVYYACIPDLWLFDDADDDGLADARRSLHHGYGVHVSFLGHDLHGLLIGPDGKLYFSLGDRGMHVETADGVISLPDTGAVLRCNLDGSELEVFATGLRNPQELAFNELGDLFTGDNNSDGGDQARLVHVAQGGDSGWRIGYQYINEPVHRGPWNEEQLWKPEFAREAGYLVPPITNLGAGPSGICYYPGTGLSDEYRGRFFLCDFRGASFISGIRSFTLRPKGASYELGQDDQFVWSVLATDVDFGPDGALYFTDWTEGWDKPGKGRIYRLADPSCAEDPQLAEVKRLIAEGMAGRGVDELARLLAHDDMRIRCEAQFELAARGDEGAAALRQTARDSDSLLAHLHGIWGLGMAGRAGDAEMLALLDDAESEVRAQAAKVLGESRVAVAHDALVARLADDAPRVRYFAALALARIGTRPDAVEPLLAMVRENDDRDAYLRHAGAMALDSAWSKAADADAKSPAAESLKKALDDPSYAVRLATLVALRRLESAQVAHFVNDVDERLQLEAARAIYDVPIAGAMPQLAATLAHSTASAPLVRRRLAANLWLGGADEAERVAAFAASGDAPEELRVAALETLAAWTSPPKLDRVTGLWRPLEPRPAEIAADAARGVLPDLLLNAPNAVRQAAAELAGAMNLRETSPMLAALVANQSERTAIRTAALDALDRFGAIEATSDSVSTTTAGEEDQARLRAAIAVALEDDDARLRSTARRVLARIAPDEAVPLFADVLADGTIPERQAALATLADMRDADVDRLLAEWLDRLYTGDVPPEIVLDLLLASADRSTMDITAKLARHEAARAKDDPLAAYRETLVGGDEERGRQIFFDKTEVACLRCHKVKGQGGDVGPDLSTIASREKREYLLEAIVAPSRTIAKGFETVVVALDSGKIVTGVIKSEDDELLRLITPEGQPITIRKTEIDERSDGASAMPDKLLEHLSKAEIRDLVEYLSTLR